MGLVGKIRHAVEVGLAKQLARETLVEWSLALLRDREGVTKSRLDATPEGWEIRRKALLSGLRYLQKEIRRLEEELKRVRSRIRSIKARIRKG